MKRLYKFIHMQVFEASAHRTVKSAAVFSGSLG